MKHFINGIEISPRNRDEIGVISNFSGSPDQLRLSTDSVILPREAYDIIQTHIQQNGVFIGLPYQVTLSGGINLDYYIDLTEKPQVRQHEIEVTLKRRKGIDDFMEKAQGTSFELMAKSGVQFNIRVMPYFVIKDNMQDQLLTLAITTYVISKEIIQATREVAEATNEFIAAIQPIPVITFSGVGFAYNTAAIWKASINLLVRAIYLAGLVILLLKLANDMFKILFPPKRYLKGVYFFDLMKKGCQFLGYDFQTTLFSENSKSWFCLPVPLTDENESIFEYLLGDLDKPFNKGYPSASDTVGLFGNFIEEMKKIFNAEIFIQGNVVRLERRDYQMNVAQNVVIPSLSLQGDRDDQFTYNTDEAWKRYYIRYALDYTDVHSIEGPIYEMHDVEYSMENNVPVTDNDLVLIKGLNEVPINFALGANKTKFTILELAAIVFYGIVDVTTWIVTLGFNGTNFVSLITDRLGALKVSQQYWGITKALYVKNAGTKKVKGVEYPQVLFDADYRTEQSAARLWTKYHYINAIDQNNFLIREKVRFRLRANEFVSLLNSNYALIDNKVCELVEITWIDEKSFAEITYKEPFDYAVGKVNIIRVDD